MLMPPLPDETMRQRTPREVVFVLDTSGSMAGTSIRAAKSALKNALRRLDWQDHFNIVLFNSETTAYAPGARRASRGAIEEAVRWVNRISADGGTELLKGLQRAIETRDRGAQRLRQMVFITDGAIRDHESLFQAIDTDLGDDRLFTVGIGNAPNTHLMTEMAHHGGGTSTYIAEPGDVAQKMGSLLRQLESPALTNLTMDLPVGADILPRRLPDLYAGEPLMAFMKLDAMPHQIRIQGQRNGQSWEQSLALPEPAQQAGIAQAWAREKLRHWQRKQARGADRELVREASLRLALAHRLVSPYTSLVAVDKTSARVREAMLERYNIEGELPHGMRDPAIRLARTATPAQLLLMIAGGLLLLAAILWMLSRRRS